MDAVLLTVGAVTGDDVLVVPSVHIDPIALGRAGWAVVTAPVPFRRFAAALSALPEPTSGQSSRWMATGQRSGRNTVRVAVMSGGLLGTAGGDHDHGGIVGPEASIRFVSAYLAVQLVGSVPSCGGVEGCWAWPQPPDSDVAVCSVGEQDHPPIDRPRHHQDSGEVGLGLRLLGGSPARSGRVVVAVAVSLQAGKKGGTSLEVEGWVRG